VEHVSIRIPEITIPISKQLLYDVDDALLRQIVEDMAAKAAREAVLENLERLREKESE